MKIYYLNDTKRRVDIYKNTLNSEDFIKTLDGVEGITVEIDVPEGCIPFVKAWTGYVLISYTPPLSWE